MRQRQSMNGGGSERGRHGIRNRLQALSCQHRARRGARTHGPRDHDPSWSRRSTDWATQAPQEIQILKLYPRPAKWKTCVHSYSVVIIHSKNFFFLSPKTQELQRPPRVVHSTLPWADASCSASLGPTRATSFFFQYMKFIVKMVSIQHPDRKSVV